MELHVTADRILVRPDPLPEMTKSGLHLMLETRPNFTGTVVALGEGPVTKRGVRLEHYVELGDHVIFSPSAGEEMYFENEVLFVMREEDVLAVIDKE